MGAVLYGQHGSRSEFAHAREHRVRRGGITIAQKEIQSCRIDFEPIGHCGANGADLGTEIQATRLDSVVERFDPEWVACENKAPLSLIPNSQTKHAIESIENLVSPLDRKS